jgi:hypothetical protein
MSDQSKRQLPEGWPHHSFKIALGGYAMGLLQSAVQTAVNDARHWQHWKAHAELSSLLRQLDAIEPTMGDAKPTEIVGIDVV